MSSLTNKDFIENARLMVNGITEYYEALLHEDMPLDTDFFNMLTSWLVEDGADETLLQDKTYIQGLLVGYKVHLDYLQDL